MINVRVPTKFMKQITLRRYSVGTYVDGEWVDGAPSDTTIMASVQPAGNDLRLLPEGDRGKKVWKLFSNTVFQMGDDDGIKSDEILVDGTLFRISNYENYSGFGHSEALFVEATT